MKGPGDRPAGRSSLRTWQTRLTTWLRSPVASPGSRNKEIRCRDNVSETLQVMAGETGRLAWMLRGPAHLKYPAGWKEDRRCLSNKVERESGHLEIVYCSPYLWPHMYTPAHTCVHTHTHTHACVHATIISHILKTSKQHNDICTPASKYWMEKLVSESGGHPSTQKVAWNMYSNSGHKRRNGVFSVCLNSLCRHSSVGLEETNDETNDVLRSCVTCPALYHQIVKEGWGCGQGRSQNRLKPSWLLPRGHSVLCGMKVLPPSCYDSCESRNWYGEACCI